MGAGRGTVLLLRQDQRGCQGRVSHELALRAGHVARRGRAEPPLATTGALTRCRGGGLRPTL
jgi:hypothetical protein